jgi:Ca2+-binding RTX toxin-like protein
MKLRAALTVALVVPSAIALSGPTAPTYAAAAVCQGQPATIEGSTGTISGTEGNDVIVSTGPDTEVQAKGGNDLICVVGGSVYSGLGDDSVVSTAPVGIHTFAYLFGGTDTFVGGAGSSDVIVDELSSFHVTFSGTSGTMELYPTTIPGAGTVDFGTSAGYLYAFGLHEARVDLVAQTASVDGLLSVTTVGVHSATATGCKVRMKGDDEKNDLGAFGHNIVITGGGGRDKVARIGNGFDLDLPKCGAYKSVLRGQAGPDRLTGRRGDDVLIGGRGHDVAQGAGGVDTCRTEVRKNCER